MHYTCKKITTDLKPEWDRLCQNNPAGGFHQSFEWTLFKNKDGWSTYKIGLFNKKNKLVGGLVAFKFHFKKTNFIYIPEGPILPYDDEDELYLQWRVLEIALHRLADIDGNELTTHIRMEPRIKQVPKWFLLGWKKAPINLQPKHTEILELTSTLEDLLAGMKPKGRYNIRLAEKKGVTVRKGTKKDLQTFFELYKTTYTRNKFNGKDKELFDLLFQTMGNAIEIYIAELDGVALASALVVHYGKRTTYLYGASSHNNKKVMAPYALHWHIIKEAKKNGAMVYDFWGIAKNVDNEKHAWHGITRFKKKFGGTQKNFIGAYDYVIARELYEKFVEKHES